MLRYVHGDVCCTGEREQNFVPPENVLRFYACDDSFNYAQPTGKQIRLTRAAE